MSSGLKPMSSTFHSQASLSKLIDSDEGGWGYTLVALMRWSCVLRVLQACMQLRVHHTCSHTLSQRMDGQT